MLDITILGSINVPLISENSSVLVNVWFFFFCQTLNLWVIPMLLKWLKSIWLKSICHVSWAENIYLIASNLNILKYHESNLEKPLKSYPKIKTQNTIYIIVWACPKPSLNTEATTSLSTCLFSDVSLVAHCFSTIRSQSLLSHQHSSVSPLLWPS